ncbi:YcjF family protein [Pseudoalteromonas denitrificans]|uniref:Uncharacterized conserved protein, DUF697 family n=1 Tax=Pseudoalteromonas denitrificans DSM 6059 TaxID=1123010 RepID=A0A1I1E2W8_9GAMM|nr:DUF697 domain-containing protein [Pseudoalteromonas denitrificans]SFB79568.1 Uncharacterized conserved protein, DUF697 family [Pseudoalteromonas denitrificans DSM 6059]
MTKVTTDSEATKKETQKKAPTKKEAAKKTAEPVNETQTEAQTPIAIDKAIPQAIIEKYSKWSFGAGLIPVPAIDLVALTAIQLKMVAEIAEAYGESFSENRVKSVVTALLGGAIPQTLTTGGISSTLKAIPIFGSVVGMATMPLISAAATYAIGATFINHFESGGTLLDINLSDMKESVKENIKKYKNKNKKLVEEAKNEVTEEEKAATEDA